MNWIDSLLIRSRLLLLLALMSLVTSGLGLYGGVQLGAEANRSEAALRTHLSAVRVLGEVRAGVANARRYEKDQFLNLGDEERTAHYRQAWAAEVDGLLRRLDTTAAELPSSGQASIAALRQGIGNYRRGVLELGGRVDRGELNDPWAANKAMESYKTDIRAADMALAQLVKAVEADAQEAQSQLAARTRRAHLMLGAATLLAILAGAALTHAISRSITRPLRELQRVAGHWAEGDFRSAAPAAGRSELAQVQRGLNEMRNSLVTLLGRVRHGADSIAAASADIKAGNQDLARRTEQSAASLQETAASMEQLAGTVHRSADSARSANGLAASAAASAGRGGAVVARVVATMDEINAASRRIADIIGVIDGIAFQTNILALNAAVEAARAGEQGRGFAVVAGEVRTLAQRSADAAREIKTLIGGSGAKVQAGAALVREAGLAMDEIVADVQRVNETLAGITASAREQSDGIGQVNAAVTQLDGATQRNAALVEQSTAAAQGLQAQAACLKEAIAVFRIDAMAPG